MATVEQAIRNLKAGRSGLYDEINEARVLLGNTYDKAEERRLRALIKEDEMRIECINYALSFLREEEEITCPD